jgi:hypothetical protein
MRDVAEFLPLKEVADCRLMKVVAGWSERRLQE